MTGPGRRFRVLVNPVSGGGSAPAAVARLVPLLQAGGAEVDVVPSASAEASRQVVAEAAAAGEVVVAAGGDGMLASVAGAVVAHDAVLGIVPSGRGNDFARMLGLDATPEALARTLLTTDPDPVDVIRVTGRDARGVEQEHVVLGSVYAGVDSLASVLVDRARRLPSAVQYPYAAVRALLTYRTGPVRVTVDGTPHELDAYSVVVANSGYYGKGMRIAPAADVRDGLLDVVVLPAGSRLAMVRRLPKVYDGTHADLPGVLVLRGREVVVERPGGAADGVPAYGDGELLGALPRTARVVPGALRVLARPSGLDRLSS